MDRPKFKVTFYLRTGARPQFTLYADTAEHAASKARKRLPRDAEVEDYIAEEVTNDRSLVRPRGS